MPNERYMNASVDMKYLENSDEETNQRRRGFENYKQKIGQHFRNQGRGEVDGGDHLQQEGALRVQ